MRDADQRLRRVLDELQRVIAQGPEGGFSMLALLPEDARFLEKGLARYFGHGSLDRAFGVIRGKRGRPAKGIQRHSPKMPEVARLRALTPPMQWKLIAETVSWPLSKKDKKGDGAPHSLKTAFGRWEQWQADIAEREAARIRQHLATFKQSDPVRMELLGKKVRRRLRLKPFGAPHRRDRVRKAV